MDTMTYSNTGLFTSIIALISSNEIASWVYIIVATISVLLGLISLIINMAKSLKDGELDEAEREALNKQISDLQDKLDKINNNKKGD